MSNHDNERFYLIQLYDLYMQLFSKKQREYFEYYYFHDWSLSEIADANHVSRSAIVDALKKVATHLNEYENKLKLYTKRSQIKIYLEESNLKDVWEKINKIYKSE